MLTQIDLAYNAERYRFLCIRQFHDGTWEATLGLCFHVQDTRGSSLGGIVAGSHGAGTPQAAVTSACLRIEELYEKAMAESLTRPVAVQSNPFLGKSVKAELDDLSSILGL